MLTCCTASFDACDWIIDSGALDHMTCNVDILMNLTETKNNPKLNLPNGKTSVITHVGDKKLENNLLLKNVLYVPEFKHNLLSVNRLVQTNKY